MSPEKSIAIYLPLFIIFFIILPQRRNIQNLVIHKIKKKKGVIMMTNEIIRKCIGKNCTITTGTFGVNAIGKIVDVNENWIEIETKKGNQLINAEFVQTIKVNP